MKNLKPFLKCPRCKRVFPRASMVFTNRSYHALCSDCASRLAKRKRYPYQQLAFKRLLDRDDN